MFKNLWEKIRNLFETPESDITDVRSIAMTKYNTILRNTRKATSLVQLLEARTNIRNLQQYLIDSKQEAWGRKLIIDLNLYWKAKYEYWKKKTRGG